MFENFTCSQRVFAAFSVSSNPECYGTRISRQCGPCELFSTLRCSAGVLLGTCFCLCFIYLFLFFLVLPSGEHCLKKLWRLSASRVSNLRYKLLNDWYCEIVPWLVQSVNSHISHGIKCLTRVAIDRRYKVNKNAIITILKMRKYIQINN